MSIESQILNLRDVSDAISQIDMDEWNTFVQINNEFFSVMRQFGIKKYAVSQTNGVEVEEETPEWKMCHDFFIKQVVASMVNHNMFGRVPDDLKYY